MAECLCLQKDCRLYLLTQHIQPPKFECRWEGCNKRDLEQEELKDHLELKHIEKNSSGYVCKWEGCTCVGAWKKDSELRKHLNDKHHHYGYNCEWKGCDFMCCYSGTLMKHLEDTHIGKRNKIYKCEWRSCDYETKNKKRSELLSHITKHHNHIYIFCERCNEGFCRKQDFTRHDKNFASSEPSNSKSKCSKSSNLNTPSSQESYSDTHLIQTPTKSIKKETKIKEEEVDYEDSSFLDGADDEGEEIEYDDIGTLIKYLDEINPNSIKEEYGSVDINFTSLKIKEEQQSFDISHETSFQDSFQEDPGTPNSQFVQSFTSQSSPGNFSKNNSPSPSHHLNKTLDQFTDDSTIYPESPNSNYPQSPSNGFHFSDQHYSDFLAGFNSRGQTPQPSPNPYSPSNHLQSPNHVQSPHHSPFSPSSFHSPNSYSNRQPQSPNSSIDNSLYSPNPQSDLQSSNPYSPSNFFSNFLSNPSSPNSSLTTISISGSGFENYSPIPHFVVDEIRQEQKNR